MFFIFVNYVFATDSHFLCEIPVLKTHQKYGLRNRGILFLVQETNSWKNACELGFWLNIAS